MSRRFWFHWLPVLVWMGVIFWGSTNALANRRTGRWIGPILRWLKPDISDAAIYRVHYAIRKSGHTFEFAILAFLCWRAFTGCGWLTRNHRTKFCAVILFCFLYATSDEYHQAFYPSREAAFHDVLIDTAGALLGLSLVLGVQRRRRALPRG